MCVDTNKVLGNPLPKKSYLSPSCAELGTVQLMKSVRKCSDELASMVRSGRISSIESLKRGKLYETLRTFIGHNSISKTDETRG